MLIITRSHSYPYWKRNVNKIEQGTFWAICQNVNLWVTFWQIPWGLDGVLAKKVRTQYSVLLKSTSTVPCPLHAFQSWVSPLVMNCSLFIHLNWAKVQYNLGKKNQIFPTVNQAYFVVFWWLILTEAHHDNWSKITQYVNIL